MAPLVARALALSAMAVAWLRAGRRAAQGRDEFLRAGGDGDPLTVAQAALRGGGESAWMRHGGG
jgi:hypothetical protein